jgi:hypothetical protein
MRAVEALPVEGLANYGLLGIVLGVLFTFAWIAYKDALTFIERSVHVEILP